MPQLKTAVIIAQGESSSVARIAEQLGVGGPTASHLVGRLVEAGLVERTEDPEDHRRVSAPCASWQGAHHENAALFDSVAAPFSCQIHRLTPASYHRAESKEKRPRSCLCRTAPYVCGNDDCVAVGRHSYPQIRWENKEKSPNARDRHDQAREMRTNDSNSKRFSP